MKFVMTKEISVLNVSNCHPVEADTTNHKTEINETTFSKEIVPRKCSMRKVELVSICSSQTLHKAVWKNIKMRH